MTAITPLLAFRDRRTRAATTLGLPERPDRRAAPRRGSAARVTNLRKAPSPTGNHTDGVTVADLFAKVTGTEPHGLAPAIEPKRRRAKPEPEPLTTVLPAVGRRPGRT